MIVSVNNYFSSNRFVRGGISKNFSGQRVTHWPFCPVNYNKFLSCAVFSLLELFQKYYVEIFASQGWFILTTFPLCDLFLDNVNRTSI